MTPEELARLAEALTADVGYATGERKFPRALTADEAADLAEALQRTVEHWTGERVRLAAERGARIACEPPCAEGGRVPRGAAERGCTGCCEELVIVSDPEARAVVRWLARPENAEARAAFLDAYPRWRAAAGDAPEQLAALTVHNRDRAAYAEAHVAYWRRRTLCAFNQAGSCTIYPVRPLVCRDAHAVGTNERCFGDYTGSVPAQKIRFGPLVDRLAQAHHVLQAAHNAISERTNQHAALCAAVHALLTA
jgi:hypothetical protein